LQSALAAPWGATLGRPGRLFGATSPRTALQGQELFENPHLIRYDANCFTINGRDALIFSGSFHYPRCPKALWRDRLAKLKQIGLNTIETCVFWNYHEPEEGHADLSEFEEFVKLVKELGFWMIVRPGPYVSAEWDVGGFPHWVVAKRFPLRSAHPENLKASQHWFSLVLPIIQRHQVLVGGPIIMMQLENEYDYWNWPEAEKLDYLRALVQMAWNAGIDIPLITCWTQEARHHPELKRVMDTCNFFPRWNVQKEVLPALTKLRYQQVSAPLGVTELQGGWFSQWGGKLSAQQEGLSGAQLSLLTKTVLEQGVTYFNWYMACGGTNFDWAAKTLTTTYDYAAPLGEPGGLREKYYEARAIGLSLGMLGPVLTRAERVEDVPSSTNPAVSVTERVSGKSGVLFVRENSNAEQRFKMIFRDPNSPTQRVISAPREGELVLRPREMRMLPVQIPIPGSQLRYSTAEALAAGVNLDRHYVIFYDEPGRAIEIGLATEDEPRVEGEVAYQYWDPEYESVVLGLRIEEGEKIILVNDHLLVVTMARERALGTFTAEFPARVVPGAEATTSLSVPFITDSVRLRASGVTKQGMFAELEFLPGQHDVSILLPSKPAKCGLDGILTDFAYERPIRRARVHVTTPALPYPPAVLNEVGFWVEKFGNAGQWLKSPARPLEELGLLPYGYVKYRAEFAYTRQPKMWLSTFADDEKKVFLNGRPVTEASNSKTQVEFPLADYASAGNNRLEIVYELFGSPNFGAGIGELKGVESVRLGNDAASASRIDAWEIQRFPAPARGREIDPEFSLGGWTPATLVTGASAGRKGASSPASTEFLPAFTWCRAEFSLPIPTEWSVPWKASLAADRDALLYLNGRFVGRYVTVGPQEDFYLPEPYLFFDPKRKNILTVVLAYADHPGCIRKLRVAPYAEFSTRRTRLAFEW